MGCHYSKLKKRNQRGSKKNETVQEQENDCGDISDAALIGMQDQETISAIKKDLNEAPETFILNNILMCTLFLRNYQQEIYEIYQQIEKGQGNFWEPDIIMERANKNVVYRPLHGPKKDIAEPLVKKRIYVPMNEFVDVYNPLDDAKEDESNASSKYQVKTEESKRQGYVKLQRTDGENNFDSTSTKDVLIVPSSNTSGSSDTESTGTSNGVTVKENPQLVKDQIDEGTLDDCFVFRKVKKPDIDIEMEELDHDNLTDDDIYDIVSYLPSRNFMKHFQSKVFKESIAKQLGLVQYEIDNAVVDEYTPGKVFCNLKDDHGNYYPVEVTPCLKSSWPNKQTYEFLERKRPNDTNECNYFQWPTEEMLNVMKQLECALVPKGYSRTRGEYPEGDLEWEIHFPLAESYLEALLRPEQIKCYLVLLTIYKEYLEPFTKSHGILPEHFLTLILWESEKNYDAWPEHRLGLRLINIIENFSTSLSKRSLRDYFIRKKNVLKNVSRKYLEHANEVFHKLKQSPVMLIIRALRNIRYNSGSFYPPLNYKELLDILYKKDWDKHPFLSNLSMNYYNSGDNISVSTSSLEKKPKFADAEKQLEYVKERERRKRLIRKREKQNNNKNVANLRYNVNLEARRTSCDSVNDDWECEKRFDRQKKIALLKFFINSYIDIAKTSHKISSKKQTMFYLKQAWYLTKILQEENQLFAEEVTTFFKIIQEEENKVITAMNENIETYGTLDVINNNNIDNDKNELEENLATLDDLLDEAVSRYNKQSDSDSNQISVDVDIHQQIRHKKINLRSLSRSFSSRYNHCESSVNFR